MNSSDLVYTMDGVQVFLEQPICNGWYKLPPEERIKLLDAGAAPPDPMQRQFISRKEIAREFLRINGALSFEQRKIVRLIMEMLRMNGWKPSYKRIGYTEDNQAVMGLRRVSE